LTPDQVEDTFEEAQLDLLTRALIERKSDEADLLIEATTVAAYNAIAYAFDQKAAERWRRSKSRQTDHTMKADEYRANARSLAAALPGNVIGA
jgi:hypothetical protein